MESAAFEDAVAVIVVRSTYGRRKIDLLQARVVGIQ
jgi:hypothetical protein